MIINLIKNNSDDGIFTEKKYYLRKRNILCGLIKIRNNDVKYNFLSPSKFTFSIILLFILYKYKSYIIQSKNNNIYHEEKFDSYLDAFNKAKSFIDNNLKGKLINYKKIDSSKNPEIAAIIPCHNCKNYILRAVRSIQNQNILNLEIIIGNDFSNDGSLPLLEQLKKEDSRIRIINNKKNMGTLYTRSIGTLSSKGKYIFPVDSDDMVLDSNVFSSISKIADKGNFDLLIFNSIVTDLEPNVNSTKIYLHSRERNHKPNLVLFQPDLGYYPLVPNLNSSGFIYNEVLIFAKCIKSSIYKSALLKLGKNRFSRYMILGEDDIANNIIFNTANIAKFIPKYVYLHIERRGSISTRIMNPDKRLLNNLYILDVMIDFSKNVVKNKIILLYFN